MLRRGCILVVLAALAIPASGLADSSTAESVTRSPTLEALVLQQINEVRAAHGLPALAPSGMLTRAALGHSRSMMRFGYFTHESRNGAPFWQRLKMTYPQRSNGWTVGENLAMFDGNETPTAAAIVAAWMSSPLHRANVLRPVFRDAGVAILRDPAAGGVFGGLPTWVVTLDFGRR